MPDGEGFTTRYRLLRELGSGGMGTVWLARDEMLDREVAVKELTLPAGMNEAQRADMVARAVREAQATAQLRHPAVVAVHDVAVHDGRPWIVMELLRGRTLTEVVEEQGPLPPERLAELGAQLLDGLAAAHTRGIQHRDVKPGNVFLTDSGRIVLTDFGIARLAGDATLTQTGMLIGSPGFIAPERLDGDQGGPASDLWSLGATLYFGVEGVPAIEGDTMARLAATLAGRIRPPRRSGALGPVLMAMLAHHPAQRPDAGSLRWLLDQVAAGNAPLPPLPPPPLPDQQAHGPAAPVGTGPHGTGPHGTGPYGTGPHGMGPHGTGPYGTGPHGMGPHGTGPVGAGGTGGSSPVPAKGRRPLLLWGGVAVALCLVVAAVVTLRFPPGKPERTSYDQPVDFCKLLTADQVRQIMNISQPPAGKPDGDGCSWIDGNSGLALLPLTDSDTPQPWAMTPETAHALFTSLDREYGEATEVNWSWKEIGVEQVTAQRTARRQVPGLGEEAFAYDLTSPPPHEATHTSVVTFRLLDLVVEAQYSSHASRPTDDDIRNRALEAARRGEAALRGLE
ncbi:serine/threonine-protein kinase [Planomonospora corallina]|uniref:non-specific serine/threonine protein kinase n=1 Tax=Planomonospora corallina TaxID=1806052 RepID=A0ABV8IDQ5_9ACTN